MKKPRDMHAADRVGAVRAARHLSNIVSPPVMFAAVGLALAVYELGLWPGILWGAVYGLIVSLLPMLVVFYLLRTGRIAELHMSATNERHIPYLTAALSGALAFALIVLFDGPELLRCLSISNVITLGSLGLINTRWLISIHATAAAASWAVMTLVFGWVVGLILLPLVVLICYVRLFLKRHTLSQVFGGLILGLTIILGMAALGCFRV